MLATMETLALLDMSDDLASMVLVSAEADRYRECAHQMETSLPTQQRIKRLAKIKEQYDEVQRFGRYHPDYKEVNRLARQYKRDVDMDEHVAAFRQAEMDLQSLLDEISLILADAVSENIKVPTGNPFFETKSSCSTGGCGSGGGCGCSA
ncbi:YlbF family regulator [Listeria rocourtiae]|uniref:YlbF family regulator n=1 Tax=Listeria rocourtiae TaxID=647910 RepID=UPI003D2F5991